MWNVTFKGEALPPEQYDLEIKGSSFLLTIRDLHLESGTRLSVIVDTESKTIHCRGVRNSISVMASSISTEVDEIKRICFDINNLEDIS